MNDLLVRALAKYRSIRQREDSMWYGVETTVLHGLRPLNGKYTTSKYAFLKRPSYIDEPSHKNKNIYVDLSNFQNMIFETSTPRMIVNVHQKSNGELVAENADFLVCPDSLSDEVVQALVSDEQASASTEESSFNPQVVFDTKFQVVKHNGKKMIVKKSDYYTQGPSLVWPRNLEVEILKATCGHPNIVTMYGSFEVPSTNVTYAMLEMLTPSYGGKHMPNLRSIEFCESQDPPLQPDIIFAYFACGIAKGLHYLHSKGFAHRDLYLKNTAYHVVDRTPIFKLIDFNMSQSLDSASQSLDMQTGKIIDHGAISDKIKNRNIDADVKNFLSVTFELLSWNVTDDRSENRKSPRLHRVSNPAWQTLSFYQSTTAVQLQEYVQSSKKQMTIDMSDGTSIEFAHDSTVGANSRSVC